MSKLGKDHDKRANDAWTSLIEKAKKIKRPKVAVKKKLFYISSKDGNEEYFSAFSAAEALENFLKIHPHSKDATTARVPNNWETRFPLLWKRIGI